MIKSDEVPCRYFRFWQENQSPISSGQIWLEEFCDCDSPNGPDEMPKECIDTNGVCPECSGYEPTPLAVCEKHGTYVPAWGCTACENEFWAEYDKE